jgi:hypothetical protein
LTKPNRFSSQQPAKTENKSPPHTLSSESKKQPAVTVELKLNLTSWLPWGEQLPLPRALMPKHPASLSPKQWTQLALVWNSQVVLSLLGCHPPWSPHWRLTDGIAMPWASKTATWFLWSDYHKVPRDFGYILHRKHKHLPSCLTRRVQNPFLWSYHLYSFCLHVIMELLYETVCVLLSGRGVHLLTPVFPLPISGLSIGQITMVIRKWLSTWINILYL